MGIIYKSSDSQDLINGMNANIIVAKQAAVELLNASQTLTDSIGSGKMLDGEAFNAGKDLFSQLLIPTINQAVTTVDDIKSHLSQYETANGEVSGEGVLDEDKLIEKRNSTMNLQTATYNTANGYRTIAAASVLLFPQLASALNEKAIILENYGHSLQQDIEMIIKKLEKLCMFDSAVNGLFNGDLDKMKLVLQSASVLNGTAVNTKTGSFELPAGTDYSWFKSVKSEDYSADGDPQFEEEDGFTTVETNASWVDENGQHHDVDQTDIFTYSENTKNDYKLGDLNINKVNHDFIGSTRTVESQDYGHGKSYSDEWLTGVRREGKVDYIAGEGTDPFRSQQYEFIAGAWGHDKGGVNRGPYGISAYRDVENKAGTEAKSISEYTVGEGPLKVSVRSEDTIFAGVKSYASGYGGIDFETGNVGVAASAGVFVGTEVSSTGTVATEYSTTSATVSVKEGWGVNAGGGVMIEDGHLKVDLELGAALGMGIGFKVSQDIDLGGAIKDLESWLNPFD